MNLSSFCIKKLDQIPQKLLELKKPPEALFYTGDIGLLDSQINVAIIGTRKPNPYTKALTSTLAKELSKCGANIISGGALGVDIIAHQNSLPKTIMIAPSSLDYIYPSANAHIIKEIAQKSLIISEYEKNFLPKKYSFLQRNRLVIGLSDIVIIPQADLNSGSMQSAKMALDCNKPLYVLPHRLNESLGTNNLLQKNLAKAIYDIYDFIASLKLTAPQYDAILDFCSKNNDFEEAYLKFGDRLLEYELDGKIKRENNKVILL